MVVVACFHSGKVLKSYHECALSQAKTRPDMTLDFCLLLFYTIATVLQLYHGGDMMYEMRRRESPSLHFY